MILFREHAHKAAVEMGDLLPEPKYLDRFPAGISALTSWG